MHFIYKLHTGLYYLYKFLYSHKLLNHQATSLDLFIIIRLLLILEKSGLNRELIKKLMLIFQK